MEIGLSALQAATLAAAWLVYGAIHSLLAADRVKAWASARWPHAMPAYRLAFNLLAVVLLVPPLALTLLWQGPLLWQWQGLAAWLANGLALAALGIFAWSLRFYDMRHFSGTAQWRSRQAARQRPEALVISPLHRYVRHPWYALALVVLWTRDMDAARLLSTLCVSLYFWLGSLLEERKLLRLHGAAYARYRQRVAGLIPWPGRVLGRTEAQQIMALRERG